MMDNLKQLAALVQVFQGLQGKDSMGDISQLAQLDMANRESGNKQRYYDQNQALEREKFNALLQHQNAQTQMGQDELGLRRQGEARLSSGQEADNAYKQQLLKLQQDKASMMEPYYQQLIESSGVSAQQRQLQMQALQHFMAEQNGAQATPTQLGPAELQWMKQFAEQLKGPQQ